MITILQPIWLILAIPLLVIWRLWKPSSRFIHYLRSAILILILLALAGLSVELPSRQGTIVIVADRSLSMPSGSDAAQKEAIDLIQRAMSSEDKLAIVAFGENAMIERSPQSGAFAGFTNQVDGDASNLAEAIDKAAALIPSNAPGKILLISDGRWTGDDPIASASKVAAKGVAIDYRSLQRSAANDLAISQIDSPVTVTPGEAFMITAWVKSPVQQEISYQLSRGGQTLAAGKTTVTSGLNRLTFRDGADNPGAQRYFLKITGAGDDPVPENNAAKILVGIQGPKTMLVLSSSQNSGLARLLSVGGMKLNVLNPDQAEWSLDALAQYSSVLIENVQAGKIGESGMQTLSSWVTETGAGLMMTGGKNSYGSGGYFKSPLEEILPVSMELRREHRKLSLAIVVVMDRSGSMAVPVAGGRVKMDLANLAAVQVLDMLSPLDEFGVIAVDSSSHTILDLNSVDVNAKQRNRILQVDSMGGGIFIFEALTAAAEMALKAKSGTKHIILFADAADSEEPGKYQELLQQCEQAGITVSVIGLGAPADVDADLLRDIAKRGNGQAFFTDNAQELPRLFAQDTIVVARSAFLEDKTAIQFTGGLVTLTGKQFTNAPTIDGYNLTYLRPKASLGVVTTDEYQAPVMASWQAGSGRILCYTGEVDGAFAGEMSGWKNTGELFTSFARWTAGEANNLPGDMAVTQEVKNGVSVIQLHLDPEREDRNSFQELPGVVTLRGAAGSKPVAEKAEMKWISADSLELSIPLKGDETTLSTVEAAGIGRVTLAPVTLPYSPEFKPVGGDEGKAALARVAALTGGQERIELSGIWKDLPRKPRLIDLSTWLLLTAVALLLLEVLERQTGLATSRLEPVFRRDRSQVVKPLKSDSKPRPEAKTPEPAAILDALKQAREQSKEKTKR